jgi:hypothetical protein
VTRLEEARAAVRSAVGRRAAEVRCPGFALLIAIVASALPGCGGADSAWTVAQAEAIDSVRGLPVRVRECRGRGEPLGDGGRARYQRLSCVAGARLPGERFDTVAVLFDVRPGSDDDHELENVRFVGGPGIP